jgi:DNA-binding NarL/FixJ family response regulator
MRQSSDRTAVVLDEQPLWLEAMDQLLGRVGVTIVGKTTDPAEALELHPELKTVVLSATDQPHQIESAFAAGASVYCVKTAAQDDLMAGIRQAFEASIYLAHSASMSTPRESVAAPETGDLTRRELEILRLVAEGHSNSQLARMLWVTEQTVKFHLSNIYRKLNVANRTEASRWAQLRGLLSDVPVETAA